MATKREKKVRVMPALRLLAFNVGKAFQATVDTLPTVEALGSEEALTESFVEGLTYDPQQSALPDDHELAPDVKQALVCIGGAPGCAVKTIATSAGCNVGPARRITDGLIRMGLARKVKPSRGPIRFYLTVAGYQVRETVIAEA